MAKDERQILQINGKEIEFTRIQMQDVRKVEKDLIIDRRLHELAMMKEKDMIKIIHRIEKELKKVEELERKKQAALQNSKKTGWGRIFSPRHNWKVNKANEEYTLLFAEMRQRLPRIKQELQVIERMIDQLERELHDNPQHVDEMRKWLADANNKVSQGEQLTHYAQAFS